MLLLSNQNHCKHHISQIGTEANPHSSKATVMLHGNLRSKELPIYGTKTLAIREGTLDLHGLPAEPSWTRLAATANAGDTQITLEVPVNWNVGDSIAIASTGDRHSQSENEQHEIIAISGKAISYSTEVSAAC